MGTSLVVQPFAGLIDLVPPGAQRVLINRQRAGEGGLGIPGLGSGFHFDAAGSRDLFLGGDADEIVTEIVRLAGWREEFGG
jgi:NAD-dependent SIR2 family protein deacetylase